MELKPLLLVFGTVFLAELGDKTQLATILFATRKSVDPLAVFFAASLALVASTALAVTLGATLSEFIDARWLTYAAGACFIVIGIWTIWAA